MEINKYRRRDFLKTTLRGGLLLVTAPLLKACQDEGLYAAYIVDPG